MSPTCPGFLCLRQHFRGITDAQGAAISIIMLLMVAAVIVPISCLQPTSGGGAVKLSKVIDPSRIGLYLLMILFGGYFYFPFTSCFRGSLKTFAEVQDLSKMWSLPAGLNMESFSRRMVGIPEKGLRGLSNNLMNSLLPHVPATLISAILWLDKWICALEAKISRRRCHFPALCCSGCLSLTRVF